jgi:MFS transporter, ACS family, tartrate transporter
MRTLTLPDAPVAATLGAEEAERQVYARIARRLMPILTLSYVLNYLDRNNIAFAALRMNQDLGLTATEFGVGAGVLFLGYCAFEIPSNLALYRFGARRWLARIMITWGLVSAATAFVTGPYSFYALRLLLGAAEAGFFPGVAFYLSTWFPAEYRTRMVAWFMVAVPISSVVGGPLSGLLLELDGVGGLAGWKWLFLLEGVPVALVGVALLWVLADRPEEATWLSEDERRLVRARLDRERKPQEVRRLPAVFTDRRVLLLAGIQFGFLVGSYGIGIWLPQILKTGHLSNIEIGLLTSAAYAVASVAMILWAGHVDRRGGKIRHLALSCLLSAAGFLGAVLMADYFWWSVLAVVVALVGMNGARALFWSVPPRFLSGVAAAGGLAFINSIGTMGGFVGPGVMGWLTDRTGSFSAGLLAMGSFLLLAAALSWWLRTIAAEE